MPDRRPLRTCTSCGITDDHPRDVVGAVVGSGNEPANFHMDCHAALGCRVCIHQIRGASGAQGDELRSHLVTLDPLTSEQVANIKAGKD